ncbi:MAG: ABC transporter transmembrane domain-containing protein [Rhodospirillales bacterium]|nr:ABC transporter transmembrane domain-containing protein [Rhodospirillales bacterium]
MEPTVFTFIRRHSLRQQIIILAITVVSFPFLYFSLDLPKTIINKAIDGQGEAFPIEFASVSLEQVEFLLALCFVFLALVFINGGFKFQINLYKGIIAERLLRRLRYTLLARALRFPLSQFQKTSQGELVAMVTAEVEPLGGFFGDAFALPLFQGGTFLTILVFMFVQDPLLGLAAIALIPVQGYFIPKLQRRVNAIGKERVRHVRRLSDRIGEVVSGIGEVHAHAASGLVLSDFSKRLGHIFDLRFDIYKKKFLIKFINNFLSQMTPFFFFSIGGILVIEGDLTFGALVAALAAYKDLSAPWKEMLNYYQRMADARIKYEDLIEQFQPSGMMDEEKQRQRPETIEGLTGAVVAKSVSLVDEDGIKVVDGANFSLAPGSRTAIIGPGGSGKESLAQLMARLVVPTSGKLVVGDIELEALPQAVSGARIGYVSADSYTFAGTMIENLFFGLKNSPVLEDSMSEQRKIEYDEAIASGNSTDDLEAEWIDYASHGVDGEKARRAKGLETLYLVDFGDDLFKLGLRQRIDPEARPELAAGILTARRRIAEVLRAQGAEDLVRQYKSDEFNANTTVAENILFGQPVSPEFQADELARNDFMLGLLKDAGLYERFLTDGLEAAKIVVELFANLPTGHPFFDQYSFVDEDGLAVLQKITRRAENMGLDQLGDDERTELRGLPFNLIPSRHRLGIIDAAMEEKLLELRARFREALPEPKEERVQFFGEAGYNVGLEIESNILFGSIAHGQADAGERVEAIIGDIIDELHLRDAIMDVALDMDVGNAGGRLAAAQRQKLALARCLIKRPDILIFNEALSSLDGDSRGRVFKGIVDTLADATLIWVDSEVPAEISFDTVLTVKNGRVASDGAVEAEVAAEAAEEEGEAGELAGVAGNLGRIPLLAGLDRSQLKLLAFTSEAMTFGDGDMIIRQGDIGDSAYIITDGQAKVFITRDGDERYIRTMTDNDVFGELALICDMPRTATVQAEGPVEA